jgi:Zn-dependent protease
VNAISVLQEILKGFDFSGLRDILLRVIPALLCITLHELAHGFTAYALGDNTAKAAGRLTLNPIRHLDPMGLLMMVCFHFGWAKPVPVNMYRFRNPKKGMAVTALAGPVTNLLLALVFMVLYGVLALPLYRSAAGKYLLQMLSLGAYISTGLAIFNLLPVPPLDGSKILLSVLSDESYAKLMRYERYGMILLVALVATGILGRPLSAVISAVYGKVLVPVALGTEELVQHLFYR